MSAFIFTPTRTLEMCRCSRPDTRHWNSTTITIWITWQWVIDWPGNGFGLATDLATIVIARHRPYPCLSVQYP